MTTTPDGMTSVHSLNCGKPLPYADIEDDFDVAKAAYDEWIQQWMTFLRGTKEAGNPEAMWRELYYTWGPNPSMLLVASALVELAAWRD